MNKKRAITRRRDDDQMRINDDEIFSFRWAVSEVRLKIGKLQYIIKSDILCMCVCALKKIYSNEKKEATKVTQQPTHSHSLSNKIYKSFIKAVSFVCDVKCN